MSDFKITFTDGNWHAFHNHTLHRAWGKYVVTHDTNGKKVAEIPKATVQKIVYK